MTIELVMLSLILIIMIFSLLIGLIQGFKKSMFNFFATIVFWILFWTTSIFISGDLILKNTSLYNSLSGILPNSESSSDLLTYLKLTIANSANIDAELLNDPGIDGTLTASAHAILKIVYLILLAIVFSIIKLIVYYVFFDSYCKVNKKTISKLEKKQESYVKKHSTEDKKLAKKIEKSKKQYAKNKINRPLGLASGFLRGCLSSFLILCVVNSTVKLLPSEDTDNITASTENNNTTTPSIYDFILQYTNNDPIVASAISLIKDYQKSNLINVTNMKINNTSIDDLFVDSILSGKSADYSVALRKELSIVVKVAEQAYYLTNGFDMESVNYTALNNEQVKRVETILNLLSNDDLVNNLASAIIGISLTIDSVAKYMPDNVTKEEYQSINWGNELKTIATLVSKVYSLGDLSKLDYFDLDTTTVEEIIQGLSELKSINFLGHIGTTYAIKNLVADDASFDNEIKNIESSLATLALEGKFNNDISSLKTLYTQFIDIFTNKDFSKYKDEDGKITNYIAALTSVDTTKYKNVINNVLETNFVTELMPNVLTIMREKVLMKSNPDIASLINPSITTSSDVEKEFNTVLTLIHDLTTDKDGIIHPFEAIEKYDFSLLNNINTDTIINSNLLSYAMIKIFIDTSKGQGILSSAANSLEKYVVVPDYLAEDANTTTHKFNEKWYNDGELKIMLTNIKNCGSQIKNINNLVDSLPVMLQAINANDLMHSDVLYYSVNKLINNYKDSIVIPLSDTDSESENTVNGVKINNIIKRDSLEKVLDIFTDGIIDFEVLFKYYLVDENNNTSDTPINKEDIIEGQKYVTKIDLENGNIYKLLTSKKLYDPSLPETSSKDANLEKLFTSGILRATVTKLITKNAKDVIVIPSNSTEATPTKCLIGSKDENGSIVESFEDISVIKINQFKSLVIAIDDLNLDINKIIDDPISIIDSLKDEETNDIKDCVNNIFGAGENGYSNTKYNGILHATLSKYIMDFANKEGNDIKIIIPDDCKEANDSSLLKGESAVDLIRSIVLIGNDAFTDSSLSQEELINKIVKNVINNNNSLNSEIIRATLTDYISKEDNGINIPDAAKENDVIKQKEFDNLLNALDLMKKAKNEEDPENSIDYYDLLDVNNISISMLLKANAAPTYSISNSLILRGTITDKLNENKDIVIPAIAKENDLIKVDEVTNLLKAIEPILGGETTLNSLPDLNETKISSFKDNSSVISASLIIRATITDKLNNNESIEIPNIAYDNNNLIKQEEVDNLITALVNVLGDDTTINNITNIEDTKISAFKDNTTTISKSSIFRATITKKLNDNNDIIVPKVAYDSNNLIAQQEVDNLITALVNVLGEETTINNINNIDDIKLSKFKDNLQNINNSLIFRATITDKLENNENIEMPASLACESINGDMLIKKDELEYLITSLVDVLGNESAINNINIDNIKLQKLAQSANDIKESYILRATMTKKINDVQDIVYPSEANDENNIISKTEIVNVLKSLDILFADEDIKSLTNSDNNMLNSLTLNKLSSSYSTTLKNSYILNATISKQILDVEQVVVLDKIVETKNDVKYITENEIEKLLNSMGNIFKDTPIKDLNSKLNGDSNFVDELLLEYDSENDNFKSTILRATASSFIKDNITSLKLEDDDLGVEFEKYNNIDKLIITEEEFTNLMNALKSTKQTLDPTNTKKINDLINPEALTYGQLKKCIDPLTNSYIVTKEISSILLDDKNVELLVVPSDGIINEKYIVKSDLVDFVNSISTLKNDDEKINSSTTIKESDIYEKSDSEYEKIFNSRILAASISKQIKDAFDKSDELMFLDNMYSKTFDKGVTYQTYIESDELLKLFKALNAIKAKSPSSSFSSINFTLNDDNSVVFKLTENDVKTIFSSTLLAVNLRNKVVEANNDETYFNHVLSLTTKIEKDETTIDSINSISKYVYTTINVDDVESDLSKFVNAIISLKTNGYFDALVGERADDISIYKDKAFIETVAYDDILRHSLPNIIKTMNDKNNTSETFKDLGSIDEVIPSNDKKEEQIEFWRGVADDCSDGELYNFIGFIEESCKFSSYTSIDDMKASIKIMQRSKIASAVVNKYLDDNPLLNI